MENTIVGTRRIHWLALLVTGVLALSFASASTVSTTFVARSHVSIDHLDRHYLLKLSGGAFEESDDEYDETDSDEEEEEKESLSQSAVAATKKTTKKKSKAVKKVVSESLSKSSSKTSKKSIFKIPYIVKALLNPLTVLAMTKAYFGSLFNINYMEEDPSQTLRSALEQKAKTAGPSGGKPKKKLRPGQAKTLSDLPQLSA